MKSTETQFLRVLYASIIKGFSTLNYRGDIVYLRHFSVLEQSIIDDNYLKFYNKASNEGLPNEEARVELLKKEGLWTDEDESFLSNQKIYIEGLEETKRNLSFTSQFAQLKTQINEAKEIYEQKLRDRNKLFGLTCESYANGKITELYILHSLYKDEHLKEKLFTEEGLQDVDSKNFGDYVDLYINDALKFGSNNLKKISISNFFRNCFSLCNDNVFYFFGKPITLLTHFQTELFSFGRYFNSLFTNCQQNPPEKLMSDPDALMDWFTGQRNMESTISEVSGQNVGIVGATEQDFKDAGIEIGNSPFNAAVTQNKKTFTMEELMSLSAK